MRYDVQTLELIRVAAQTARSMGHSYVGSAHLLLALTRQPGAEGQLLRFAVQILRNFDFTWPQMISLLMSAMAAGLTVGGKAIGKSFAVNSCTQIVHGVGRGIHALHNFPDVFRKKKKN